MSKERLEELEAKYSTLTVTSERNGTEYTEVDVKDLVFLIQNGFKQAERVQELEIQLSINTNNMKQLQKEKDEWKDTAKSYYMTNQELRKQNKRHCEALEFYADRNNYLPEHLDPETDEKWSKIDYDEGFNARKTLEKECTNGRYRQTNFR